MLALDVDDLSVDGTAVAGVDTGVDDRVAAIDRADVHAEAQNTTAISDAPMPIAVLSTDSECAFWLVVKQALPRGLKAA